MHFPKLHNNLCLSNGLLGNYNFYLLIVITAIEFSYRIISIRMTIVNIISKQGCDSYIEKGEKLKSNTFFKWSVLSNSC